MKTVLTSGIILALLGCGKNKNSAEVIRDCTGVYLRIDHQDYKVCNTESLESYSDGAKVKATYKKVNSCANDTNVVCMMYHAYVNEIEVSKVD